MAGSKKGTSHDGGRCTRGDLSTTGAGTLTSTSTKVCGAKKVDLQAWLERNNTDQLACGNNYEKLIRSVWTTIPVRTPSTKFAHRRLAADDTPLSRRIRTFRPSMGSTPRPNHLDSCNGDPIQEKHRRSQRTIHTPKGSLSSKQSGRDRAETELVSKPCNCVRWYKQGIKSTCTTRAMRIQYYMLHVDWLSTSSSR